MPRLLSSLILATTVTFSSGAVIAAIPMQLPGRAEASAPLLAKIQKKKKKKKKASHAESEGFGPEGIEDEVTADDSSSSLHHVQEGVDVPYKAEAALSTDLSLLDTKVGDADSLSHTLIDVAVEWLFIVGSFEVGPDLRYNSDTTAEPQSGAATVTQINEVKTESYSAGGLFKWNFASLDHADLVPFAYGGIAYRAGATSTGDTKTKSSGTILRAGGGLNMFLTSHVAFNPRGEYFRSTDKNDDDAAAVTTTTSGFKILLGIAVFI